MSIYYSKEEKDAVVDFCIECIKDRFSSAYNSLWYFVDTDDLYMKNKVRNLILEMDTSEFVRPAEVVVFDGRENFNDDFKFLMINDAVRSGDKIILFTNLLDYEEWYIRNHPENLLKHPLISGTINWLRDSLFNMFGARIILLISQEENKAFQSWGLDFYTQMDTDNDLDYLLKNRKDWLIFTESEKNASEDSIKINKLKS